jgi:hypothetical protein
MQYSVINLGSLGVELKEEKAYWQVQKKIMRQDIFNVSTIFRSLIKTDYVDSTKLM